MKRQSILILGLLAALPVLSQTTVTKVRNEAEPISLHFGNEKSLLPVVRTYLNTLNEMTDKESGYYARTYFEMEKQLSHVGTHHLTTSDTLLLNSLPQPSVRALQVIEAEKADRERAIAEAKRQAEEVDAEIKKRAQEQKLEEREKAKMETANRHAEAAERQARATEDIAAQGPPITYVDVHVKR